jgi:glycosyltransferase involved in cell wall biosynthesis
MATTLMNILLVHNTRLPVQSYDDAARVVYWLGKMLAQMGHQVYILAKKNTVCPFATVLVLDDKKPLDAQIPAHIDLVHFHFKPSQEISKPYLITCHENCFEQCVFDRNTVFVSAQHAMRHGGSVYVHNGIDFSEYGTPVLEARRMYYHFLGNAEWRGKNVRGAIDLAARLGARLHVIGGTRVNFRKELRITLTPNVRFHGVLNPEGRNVLLNTSKGLLFPAIWHEPFGLAVPESLYFGCPVFGTPYGALPELLGKKENHKRRKEPGAGIIEAYYSEFGCLAVKKSELVEAIKNADAFNAQHCQEYAVAHFSSALMAQGYLKLYEKVLNGHFIHEHAPALTEIPEDKFLPFGD